MEPSPNSPQDSDLIGKEIGTQRPSDVPSPPPVSQEGELAAESIQQLSKEEQLALYEEQLKNEDWGHQPC